MRLALVLVLIALAVALLVLARLGPRQTPPPAEVAPAGAAAQAPSAALVGGSSPSHGSRLSLALESLAEPLAEVIADVSEELLGETRIRVRDLDGAPVPARVVLQPTRRREKPLTPVDVDASGEAVVMGLRRVEFFATVDARSLPFGYAPPWVQETQEHYPDNPALLPRFTAPAPGEKLVIELEVFRRATVAGVVLGPAGEPVKEVVVMLGSRHTATLSRRPYARTDEHGRFEMRSVMPGPYRTQISMKPDHPYGSVRRPLPRSLDIAAGDALSLTLHLGGAGDSGVIEGRVVDEQGRPFPGIRLVCTPSATPEEIVPGENLPGINDVIAAAIADADGRYRLTHLPARRLRVTIGLGNFNFSDRWDGELGDLPTPFDVDLSVAASPFVASTVAKRNRSYRLICRVELNSDWAFRHRVPNASALEVHVTEPGAKPRELRISNREFRWGTLQPDGAVTVLVREPDTGVEKSLEVFPRASVTESLTINFP